MLPGHQLRQQVRRKADEQQQGEQKEPAGGSNRRAGPSPKGALAVGGDAVQLHAMVDQAEAELLGDLLLKRLQLLIDELDDVAGLDVDQVIVMRVRRRFIARAAVAELMPLEDSRLLEQPHRPIDCGDRDVGVDRRRARVQGLDVGMVLAVAEHSGDDPPLLGDPKALVGAQRLDVDLAGHEIPLRRPARGASKASWSHEIAGLDGFGQ